MKRAVVGAALIVMAILTLAGPPRTTSTAEGAKVFVAAHSGDVFAQILEHGGLPREQALALKRATLGEPVQHFNLPVRIDPRRTLVSQMKPENLFTVPLVIDGSAVAGLQILFDPDGESSFMLGDKFGHLMERKRAVLGAGLKGEADRIGILKYQSKGWVFAFSGGRIVALQPEFSGETPAALLDEAHLRDELAKERRAQASLGKRTRKFAENQFPRTLKHLERNRGHYGIDPDVDLSKARLGAGVPNHRLESPFDASRPLPEQWGQSNVFSFPVLVDSEPVIEFQVVQQRDRKLEVLTGGDMAVRLEKNKKRLSEGLGKSPRFAIFWYGHSSSWLVAYSGGRANGMAPHTRSEDKAPKILKTDEFLSEVRNAGIDGILR